MSDDVLYTLHNIPNFNALCRAYARFRGETTLQGGFVPWSISLQAGCRARTPTQQCVSPKFMLVNTGPQPMTPHFLFKGLDWRNLTYISHSKSEEFI